MSDQSVTVTETKWWGTHLREVRWQAELIFDNVARTQRNDASGKFCPSQRSCDRADGAIATGGDDRIGCLRCSQHLDVRGRLCCRGG